MFARILLIISLFFGAASAQAANVAVHGVAGGITSVIQGGQFQSGFLSAGFSEFAGPELDKLIMTNIGGNTADIMSGISQGAVGGAASVLGGGKFANGAITASFQYLYNHCGDGQCTSHGEQSCYDALPGCSIAICAANAAGLAGGSCSGGEWAKQGALTAAVAVPGTVLFKFGQTLYKGFKFLDRTAGLATNPFFGRTAQQIEKSFLRKGFEPRGPNPLTGRGGYVNPQTGRSYHIDMKNSFNEAPHVDVNRLGNTGPGSKVKYFLDGGREVAR